jgi:D-methionine transport system substrate-binding protein
MKTSHLFIKRINEMSFSEAKTNPLVSENKERSGSSTKLIKIWVLILSCLTAANAFAGAEVITIAASPTPHAEILKQVKLILKKQDVDLQIKEFDDYIQPNLLVDQKQIDANFIQHRPYLAQFNKERGTKLVELVAVHIEPMGVYVSANPKLADFIKTKKVAKLPKELIVGVPSDTTNEGRALQLLEKYKLIKTKAGVAYPTRKDIISNPYKLVIKELDSAMLPRMLNSSQLDLAVINSNFAIQAELNPLKDAVFIEDAKSPYVNIIVIRVDDLNKPKMKKLAAAIKTAEIKKYIDTKYNKSIVPVN